LSAMTAEKAYGENDETVVDLHMPRISYIANEICMPGLRLASLGFTPEATGDARTPNPYRWVSSGWLEAPAETVMATDMSDNPNFIIDDGDQVAGKRTIRSPWATHGWVGVALTDRMGDIWNIPEGSDLNDYEDVLHPLTAQEWLEAQQTDPIDEPELDFRLLMTGYERHNKQSNYLFADGHCVVLSIPETLDPNNHKWGDQFWALGATVPIRNRD